jgi:hypothetical protein
MYIVFCAINFKGHNVKAHRAPKPFEILMDVMACMLNIWNYGPNIRLYDKIVNIFRIWFLDQIQTGYWNVYVRWRFLK